MELPSWLEQHELPWFWTALKIKEFSPSARPEHLRTEDLKHCWTFLPLPQATAVQCPIHVFASWPGAASWEGAAAEDTPDTGTGLG